MCTSPARPERQITYPTPLRRYPGLRPVEPLDEIPFDFNKIVYGQNSPPVTWQVPPGRPRPRGT